MGPIELTEANITRMFFILVAISVIPTSVAAHLSKLQEEDTE